MRDSYKVLLHGLANSFLPEVVDADKLDVSVLSKPTLKALTQFLDHHLGDVDTGTTRQFSYGDVQNYFGNESVLVNNKDGTYSLNEGEHAKETPDQELRTILGGFIVTRTADGYNILDAYDFSQRTKGHYKEQIPKWEGDNTPMSLMDIAYHWTQQDKWLPYESVRAIAGMRIPEKNINDKSREGLNPKQSSTLSVNWLIPEGQKVKANKLHSSVITALGREN